MVPLIGIAHPEELALLTAALEAYCRKAAIEPGSSSYEDAARLIMSLFNRGASSAEELAAAMDDWTHRLDRFGGNGAFAT